MHCRFGGFNNHKTQQPGQKWSNTQKSLNLNNFAAIPRIATQRISSNLVGIPTRVSRYPGTRGLVGTQNQRGAYPRPAGRLSKNSLPEGLGNREKILDKQSIWSPKSAYPRPAGRLGEFSLPEEIL